MTTRIRGVLLDLDGTLLDSNDAHARAWVDALCERGVEARFTDVRTRIGKGGDKVLPELTGLTEDSQEGRAIAERRAEIFRHRYLPVLRPFPKARALLERMREDGLLLAVASSSSGEDLAALLRAACVDDLIETDTSSDDAARSKPDPDIVQAALEKSGLAPGEALMLGDTPWDVAAAGRAGVGIVAVRCGGWDDAALAGALAIYDGPSALLHHYDTSPFAGALAGARGRTARS